MIKHLILFYQTISWYIWFILLLNYILRLKLHITVRVIAITYVQNSDNSCRKQQSYLTMQSSWKAWSSCIRKVATERTLTLRDEYGNNSSRTSTKHVFTSISFDFVQEVIKYQNVFSFATLYKYIFKVWLRLVIDLRHKATFCQKGYLLWKATRWRESANHHHN